MTSHSTSTSSSPNGSVGSRRVQRITESASGSPDETPSLNGSEVTAGATVVVAGLVGGVVSGAEVDAPSASPSEHAASAAVIVLARKPLRVTRGAKPSLIDGSRRRASRLEVANAGVVAIKVEESGEEIGPAPAALWAE
jgi:hypothetical protein|tara:strand:+ start:821 stop:1237 length:417 start_codon:yes stop_codon:yes gene_type:complete